jgi:tryptophan 2,3-dioxygenase
MSGVTYSGYLRLPELLSAIRPLTPSHDRRTHSAEHFFIVAHQTSELWLRQVLVDLDVAVHAIDADRPAVAEDAVTRAANALRLLADQVMLLRALAPKDFAAFRGRLGDASGAHSAQFRSLRSVLGVNRPEDEGALWTGLAAAAGRRAKTVADIYAEGGEDDPLLRVAEAMADLSQAYWAWQVGHVEVVRRAIGDARGTGRTSGAEYLAGRLGAPFPQLWEARTRLHDGSSIPLPR